jgi:hypothetical protein
MEDPNEYDIEKDIPTIEELEKLGKCLIMTTASSAAI